MVEITITPAVVANARTHETNVVKDVVDFLDESVLKPARIETLVKELSEKINLEITDNIARGYYYADVLFYVKEIENSTEFVEAIEILRSHLQNFGYTVNPFHEYTKSWKTRSGKFGYLFIRWGDNEVKA